MSDTPYTYHPVGPGHNPLRIIDRLDSSVGPQLEILTAELVELKALVAELTGGKDGPTDGNGEAPTVPPGEVPKQGGAKGGSKKAASKRGPRGGDDGSRVGETTGDS